VYRTPLARPTRSVVATMIKSAVPQVKDVLDITEHAAGSNPYDR
jgi:hypothetical protein